MSQFIESAASRETSTEVMDAILIVACNNESQAARVWENPTAEEALAVWETVTNNGLRSSTDYAWGAAGSQWAATMGLDG